MLVDEPPLSVLSLHLLRDEVPLGFLRAWTGKHGLCVSTCTQDAPVSKTVETAGRSLGHASASQGGCGQHGVDDH